MLKAYPVKLTLAVVAVGATGAGVQAVLKIADGDFTWEALGIAAYDANGVLVANPNITLKLKQGGTNIFADEVSIGSLQRGDQPSFKLPEKVMFKQNTDLSILATGQSGSTVTTLNLTLMGTEPGK